MRVRITMIEKTGQKLMLVKIIKDYTGWGLMESKQIVDGLFDKSDRSMMIEVDASRIADLKKDLTENLDGRFQVGDIDVRDYKILSIIGGDRSDYIDFIKGLFPYLGDKEYLVDEIMSKIELDDLMSIFNTIKEKEKYDSYL